MSPSATYLRMILCRCGSAVPNRYAICAAGETCSRYPFGKPLRIVLGFESRPHRTSTHDLASFRRLCITYRVYHGHRRVAIAGLQVPLHLCKFNPSHVGWLNVRSIRKTTALFCFVLMLWSSFAFLTHHHTGTINEAKCTACIAAHSASPAPAITQLPHVAFVVLSVFRAESVSAKQRLIPFALSNRPPPAA